jgi:hypothetical protein
MKKERRKKMEKELKGKIGGGIDRQTEKKGERRGFNNLFPHTTAVRPVSPRSTMGDRAQQDRSGAC